MDLQRRLENLGYRVAGIAASAQSAFDKAVSSRPHLVLMDVRLEGDSDGIDAARRIRDALFIPVVFITSFSDDSTLERARVTEPLGYISKPFSDRDLHTSIHMALYRHETEKQLREQRQWLNSVLHSIADAVVATDSKGRIRLLNPVAERLTGWSESEALGRPFSEVVALFDPASGQPVNPLPIYNRNNTSQNGASPRLSRLTLASRNFTEIPIEPSTAPIAARGLVEGGVFVFRDISERLRLEQDLQHAWRLESLGRLAGGVAHDFNNLLTVILGLSSLTPAEADRLADPAIRARLASIESAAIRAAGLTSRLLALGRRQLLDPHPLDVNLLLNDLAVVVRSVFPESIELKLRANALNPVVLADRSQLEQAILNILLNARDAVGDAGTVVIGTQDASLAGSPAVAIKITDTGIGIPDHLKTRIFEPFFTTKGENRGTGLGLASAYAIVSQSEGRIDVESTQGLGSTFTVLLPRHSEPVAAEPPPAPLAPLPASRPARILLVEDNDLIRDLQCEILSADGFSVQVAPNGARALQLLDAEPEAFDVVVTDVVMPGMTGIALARLAFEIRPELRILFVSGYTAENIRIADYPPGATAFLQKPFSPAELKTAIARLLGPAPRPH